MADNIFQQAIGAAPTVTQDIQAVQAAADPLIARFKSIAAAAAAASFQNPDLKTDQDRVEWADSTCWHNLRGVIGFAVDILRHSGADRMVRQYVASVIAADELAAGLAALSFGAAPPQAPPAEAPPAPQSTEGVIVNAAPAREDAAPASAL